MLLARLYPLKFQLVIMLTVRGKLVLLQFVADFLMLKMSHTIFLQLNSAVKIINFFTDRFIRGTKMS